MKKLIYILIGIFTFSIGFWLYHLRPVVMPVSLCELSQHDAELFKSKQIHVKAFLNAVGRTEDDLNSYSVYDLKNGCFADARLEISEKIKEQLKSDESLNASINLMRQNQEEAFNNRPNSSYKPVYYFAEVEITGEVEKYESEVGALVTPPPFVIKVNEIKQISPIRPMSYEELSNLIYPK
jgi:hypothetical protein